MTIAMIPASDDGHKLFLKELRQDEKNRLFVKYKSTFNNIPFMETQIYPVDGGNNYAICGDDGTVIWRFNKQYLENIS